MSQPLFSVGEEVVLQSKSHPKHNGEYIVHAIVTDNDVYPCRFSSINLYFQDGGYGYVLDEVLTEYLEGYETEVVWAECALRKKHKPSEFRFNELIKELNTNIRETCE